MEIKAAIEYLKAYDGPDIKLMEVCGTHTASIFKSGIRSIISPKIKLISGPGCPVCVTPTAYIDRCIEYAKARHHVLCTFGDMLKVPGIFGSLSDMKGQGAKVEMMYSPFEVVDKAAVNPDITYVIAAVGFETTAPTYALALDDAQTRGIHNLKFVTALKTVIPALTWICENESGIDGFICPGHVSVIIGSKVYENLAVIYDIVKQLEVHKVEDVQAVETSHVHNLYKNAVRTEGNPKALAVIQKYFETGPTMWRGLGNIEASGLYLRPEYAAYDGGSRGLDRDMELPETCRCGEVIVGRINPNECEMFGKVCNPTNPFGPCMVSSEGACGIWYQNNR